MKNIVQVKDYQYNGSQGSTKYTGQDIMILKESLLEKVQANTRITIKSMKANF